MGKRGEKGGCMSDIGTTVEIYYHIGCVICLEVLCRQRQLKGCILCLYAQQFGCLSGVWKCQSIFAQRPWPMILLQFQFIIVVHLLLFLSFFLSLSRPHGYLMVSKEWWRRAEMLRQIWSNPMIRFMFSISFNRILLSDKVPSVRIIIR